MTNRPSERPGGPLQLPYDDQPSRLEGSTDRVKAAVAVRRMMELRKGVTLGKGITLKELIDEGRR